MLQVPVEISLFPDLPLLAWHDAYHDFCVQDLDGRAKCASASGEPPTASAQDRGYIAKENYQSTTWMQSLSVASEE